MERERESSSRYDVYDSSDRCQDKRSVEKLRIDRSGQEARSDEKERERERERERVERAFHPYSSSSSNQSILIVAR